MLDDLMEAAPFVPSVLVAALISLFVTTIATGLLVIPGMWLYTRWSLATPGHLVGPLQRSESGVAPCIRLQVSGFLTIGSSFPTVPTISTTQ
jgi:hypothetical protein